MSNMIPGKLVLIIGPSGVGKSVILKTLRKKHPELHFPRSATTRARRRNEGADLYNFVTESEFDALQEANTLLEWAVVHGGARYGTLAEEIIPPIEQGTVVVREVDVQGFDSIRNHKYFRGENAPYVLQSIFILPESEEQLIRHITHRAPMAEAELKHRIASMKKELAYAEECDVQIVNREGALKETIAQVERVLVSSF
ncbi:guanylate kinase [Candidatus Peregrinibacteria bacterium CG10_big_fil_rev_8_21_14_0_10_49_10]|nr:MAG: guanylate kinase [Candidatus Peregrinibacteria bacterium CG10_big_fil_rev_8_21_14_0_10_49_10]